MAEHKLLKHFQHDDQMQSDNKYFAMFAYNSDDLMTWKLEMVPKDELGFKRKMDGWKFVDKTDKMPRFVIDEGEK